MKLLIPLLTIVIGAGTWAGAQETTTRSKTTVSADDARTITLTGCLRQPSVNLFTLRGTMATTSDDVTTRSKTTTEVDDDGADVSTRTKTEVDRDGDVAVGTAGLTATYELTPQQGVNLAAHVGRQVTVTALALGARNGDDDAEVTVKERTTVDREDAPDADVRTETRAEVPRGDRAKVTVVSVKPTGAACTD
jgi:hypothetical protein